MARTPVLGLNALEVQSHDQQDVDARDEETVFPNRSSSIVAETVRVSRRSECRSAKAQIVCHPIAGADLAQEACGPAGRCKRSGADRLLLVLVAPRDTDRLERANSAIVGVIESFADTGCQKHGVITYIRCCSKRTGLFAV